MKSVTKNLLEEKHIRQLTAKHFPGAEIQSTEEMSGGMFNAAYLVRFSSAGAGPDAAVLKVGPTPQAETLTYEKDILRAEVDVYKMLPAEGLPRPCLLAEDYSREIVPADCFFMEFTKGKTWQSLLKKLPAEARPGLMRQLGACNAAVHSVKGSYFGYIKEDERFRHDTWGGAFTQMMGDILADGEARSRKLPYDEIRGVLKKHRGILDEISQPILVDFDIHAGNVFLDETDKGWEITGIIDYERAFFGDPAADFTSAVMLFDDVEKESDFRAGYEEASGKTLVITPEDRIRMDLYRLYMMLLMNVETYRYGAAYAAALKLWTGRRTKALLKKL